MIRTIELFIFVLFFNSGLLSQTEIDFTETDINGVEHNLFSYLEAGKVVVIDVFTTNCGPCLTVHKTKLFEHVHNILGPEGMDKVVVLGFEFDTSTDEDDLFGIGDNTIGDFASGTPYPILNPTEISSELRDAYVKSGYPTVNIICPETKEIISDNFTNYYLILQELQNCITLPEFSDLVPVDFIGENKVCSSFEPVFSILNGGTKQINSLRLNLLKDGVVVQEGLNYGAIAGGQRRNLKMFEVEINGDGSEFTVEIASEDDYPENNNFTIPVNKAEAVTNEVTLFIETNSSFIPLQETVKCIIKDSEGSMVYQSTSIDLDMTIEDELTLNAGECYTFTVDGSHRFEFFKVLELKDENQNVVPLLSYWDDFRVHFSTDVQSSVEGLVEDVNFQVYPSPVVDFLSLKMDQNFNGNIQMRIIQMNGALISSEEIKILNEKDEKRIDVSGLKPGFYFLQLHTESATKTVKFVKV